MSSFNEYSSNWSHSLCEEPRRAKITVDDTSVIGVCIFLSKTDLEELGIVPDNIEAGVIEYRIDPATEQLRIESIGD